MLDDLVGVTVLECLLGEHVYLAWAETAAQDVVEEEVVQFVWSYEVFGLLCNVAVCICRNEFGRDWCIDDVEQGGACVVVLHTVGIGRS